MPYVLQKQLNGELYACIQNNHYDLAYYGVKAWESQEEAEADYKQWLQAGDFSDEWQVVLIDEHTLKLGNVKLKNNPEYVVLWSNQMLRARRKESEE